MAGAYAVFRALASMESGGLVIAGAIVTLVILALLALAWARACHLTESAP